MLNQKTKEEFEAGYKSVFQKTVDLITHYTGLRVNYEIKDFEYVESNGELRGSGCYFEHCDCCNKVTIKPTIILLEEDKENACIDKFYILSAAHEAGEISYHVARSLIGRKSYDVIAELMGKFSEKLFLETNLEMNSMGNLKDFGRYKIAEDMLNDISQLSFGEQLEKIRKLIFMKGSRKLDVAHNIVRAVDKLNGM